VALTLSFASGSTSSTLGASTNLGGGSRGKCDRRGIEGGPLRAEGERDLELVSRNLESQKAKRSESAPFDVIPIRGRRITTAVPCLRIRSASTMLTQRAIWLRLLMERESNTSIARLHPFPPSFTSMCMEGAISPDCRLFALFFLDRSESRVHPSAMHASGATERQDGKAPLNQIQCRP